jgi:hypothetical protein
LWTPIRLDGGYAPGDVYELFVGEDDRIIQWAYRHGGAAKLRLVATWKENRHLGPLVVSLNHRCPERDIHVWFADVAVKLAGSEGWTVASELSAKAFPVIPLLDST